MERIHHLAHNCYSALSETELVIFSISLKPSVYIQILFSYSVPNDGYNLLRNQVPPFDLEKVY